MLKHVFVLLDEFLGSEPAVFIEQVDFQDLFPVGRVGIDEEESDQEGEGVPEGPES